MKNNKFVKFSIVLILIGIVFIFLFMNTKEPTEKLYVGDYSTIQQKGVLRVVTDYNPINYYVSEGKEGGITYDLLQKISEQTGLKIQVELESNLSKCVEGLIEGKYDLIAQNIAKTELTQENLLLTNAVALNKLVLVQRKQEYNNGIEPLKSHLDLAHKTLYIPQSSPSRLWISNLSKEIGDTIYYKEDELYGAEQLVIRVASSEIDFAVCDEATVKKIEGKLPEINTEMSLGFTHFESWAVRKDSPVLLDSLNNWLRSTK